MSQIVANYDSLLVISFGGPEGPDDVMPFLENVLRGRNVPRERMLEVAEHYQHFGGVSPLNAQNRALIAALEAELSQHGLRLPIFFGNRNWHPFLTDTLREMAGRGHQRSLAFFTSPYSSYSSCRQYRENITAARDEVGPAAPQIDKLRVYFNHPKFVSAVTDCTAAALDRVPKARRAQAKLLFSAHSIPVAMARNCRYELQLRETSRLVAEKLAHPDWQLVFQSRSGPPSQPWLEPDVCDVIRQVAGEGPTRDIVVSPIGFISDHIEVLYDLDSEAKEVARQVGLHLVRAASVGTHPEFIGMIRELVIERIEQWRERPAVGAYGPSHDVCPVDCCLPPGPRGTRAI